MAEQLSPDALQFSETARRYGGKEAYGRDLATGRTALPYERWIQIRTPVFLAESAYGDWQSVSNRLYLDSEPITTITGEEIPADDKKRVSERVSSWYKKHHNNRVEVLGIGEILIDKNAIQDDISHGIGKAKFMAFAAVPDILQNGRIIYAEGMKGIGATGSFLYFSAPIKINNIELSSGVAEKFREKFDKPLDGESNKVYAAIVAVKAIEPSDPRRGRMYVHEVGLREELLEERISENKEPQQTEFSTGPSSSHDGRFHGSVKTGAIRSLLLRAYDVKPESLKASLIPETGEPRLDLLEKEYPSPLIDLRGLGCREAARKLHDLTRGDVAHLPLIEASIAADGSKQLDVRRLLAAQRLHPTPRKDEWLKAVIEAPQRDKQHHRQQDWDMTR